MAAAMWGKARSRIGLLADTHAELRMSALTRKAIIGVRQGAR